MLWIWIVAGIVAAVVAVDQISKVLVLTYLYGGQVEVIPGILNFTYVENDGMAFGLLSEHRWVFLVFSVVGIALMGFYLWRFVTRWKSRVALSLIIGGGIGNMIDRLSLGFVVDFIDFCAFPEIWYWVFNVADAAVCVGAGLFILDLLLEIVADAKKAKTAANGAENTSDSRDSGDV
ncbi:MAG: signal peptidase II [Clostridia bacterium]|nr:signal peptidase II [Clostridia bacterium]